MNIHSYPKVYNLGHPALVGVFSETVLLQEKIDGSQISFGVINGELCIRSKRQEIIPDAPDRMFEAGVECIKNIVHNLELDVVYRGEYLQKPKHNVIEYGRIPSNHIILFDIETDPNVFLRSDLVEEEANRIGLEYVPWTEAESPTLEDIEGFLGQPSVLGGKREGVVVKNYNAFGRDGKVLMGKHVSEEFKEVHNSEWKKANPSNKDIIGQIIDQCRNENRWQKAIQHIKEQGELTFTPQDIGKLIKEIQKDIADEEKERIKGLLWDHASKHILRGAVKGFPEWYKEKLLERQFNDR